MTTASQRSRTTAKRAAKSTATSPKSGAASGRGSGSRTSRSTKGQGGGARTTKGQGARGQGAKRQSAASGGRHDHDVTITIPVDRAADAVGKVVTLPVTAARRILPSAGGLPLYAGLGALGIAGVLEWPVAAGIGVGYAVLRRRGPLDPHPGKDAAE